ncbi:fatty-acyl-CoA synthase [Arboricoccus pini]|uniref:Fatty-acyl-CoA synthase n=1 Tax=Arboricoccus pini TaxID=1963835 RepID=A0A212QQD0_9PROT|nr:fatty acyl-AMP ligase [Arboricoccus pini]SNB61695.1 fatty-acyl-CoA synthase [Arboricoccus pini]
MLQPTPKANLSLPFKSAGFATLVDGLDYAARGETGFNFFSARGELEFVLSYQDLRRAALDLAPRFRSAGLERGDRVAVIAETTPAFLKVFFACQYAGLVPVPLPLCINFGGKDAYVARLQGMLLSAGARAAIGATELLATLEEAAIETDVRFVGTVEALEALEPTGQLVHLRPEDPCYIQYSSGSTSFPRGVLVTQAAITANARAIAGGIELRSGDRCTSWLPLYHDMGLVGCCLTPVLNQIPVDYIATTGFARRPLSWLKVLSEMGGTISFSPTFGYELCARRAAGSAVADYDLSQWRLAGIGGEMIRPKALGEFARTFAAAGFDKRAFVASYGLAEATLAVTFAPLHRGVEIDLIEQGDAFERLRLAIPASAVVDRGTHRTRAFVKCGRPMAGYALEIRDDANRRLPERTVGRVCIKGPSLMTGYFRNVEATNAVMVEDGWLDTGDMGYLVDGELVVTGRTKDLIILNGRNIWPQDLEWAIERIEGVRVGDVAAFSMTGDEDKERVVAVVQCRTSDSEAQERLRSDIHATLQRVAGVDCEVVLAPPRSLTFTTSGKLSRAAAKSKYASGAIRDVGEAAPAAAANQAWGQLALAS